MRRGFARARPPKRPLKEQHTRLQTPAWHWTLHAQENRFIPERTRPSVARLAQRALAVQIYLPTGFSFCQRLSTFDGTRGQQQRQQKRFSALRPEPANSRVLWTQLTHSFDPAHAIRAYVSGRGLLSFWLLLTHEGHPLAYAQRRVELGSATVHHDYLAFVKGNKGGGSGAQILANAQHVYRQIGIQRIELVAGLSAGSAVWPRLGFAPATNAAWSSVKKTVLQNLANLNTEAHSAFMHVHGRPLKAAVAGALNTSDPLAIFDLVDIDPGGAAGRRAGLPHGYAGELLQGGRWRGVLELDGPGGRRLAKYLAAKGVVPPGDII